MGAKYTTTTVTGYNSSPPPDDNTRGADNQLSWDKHKTKLGDPVKSAIESINTKLVNMDNTSALVKSSAYTIVAADNNKTIHATGATTLTLDTASNLGDGFRIVIVKTEAANTVTIATSSSQLINGKVTRTLTTLNEAVTISCNGSTFYIESDTGHEYSPINVVTDYGANNAGAGAGATDAHTEINLAITEAAAAGTGTVFLPAGTYDIGASINMAPGIKLMGEGPGITTLRATANSITMIDYLLSGSTTPFFNIENMSITSDDHFTVNGIVIAGASTTVRCTDVRIESLYVTGGPATEMAKGIRLDHCANTTIADVFCTECLTGIEMEMCAGSDITNCKVQNGDGNGFYLFGDGTVPSNTDEGFRLTGCSTNGQEIGIRASGVDWVRIMGCSFTTCDSGPVVAEDCTNWTLTGSEFAEATDITVAGIDMDSSCANWTIVGNYIALNNWGLDLNGTYHVVTSNIFQGNVSNDIIIQSTASHCVVNNNICRSDDVDHSIIEQSGTNYNQVSHNISNGDVTTVGLQTVNQDNIESY